MERFIIDNEVHLWVNNNFYGVDIIDELEANSRDISTTQDGDYYVTRCNLHLVTKYHALLEKKLWELLLEISQKLLSDLSKTEYNVTNLIELRKVVRHLSYY